MHIAVCDDNMGDRHQMERLLKRENDRRKGSSNLFTDSFGNCEALLANPMQYDLFFIDMCKSEGITGTEVAGQLLTRGINVPIVMCCSDINYREETFASNVLFIDKPIQAAELTKVIDQALRIRENAETLLELRTDTETYYIRESQFLYAVESTDTGRVTVTFANGQKLSIVDNIANLFSQLEAFPSFIQSTSKVILNCRYMRELKWHRTIMKDGTSLRILWL